MEVVFGMVIASVNFFVDIGNRVNFEGLNLWHISFIFFGANCVFRFLFPVIFDGESVGGFSASADRVRSTGARIANRPARTASRINTRPPKTKKRSG